MEFSRLFQTIRLWTIPGAVKRAQYIREKKVFSSFGEKCSYMDRKVPLYAKLIKVGDNVHIASNVTFLTHDVAHMMINRMNDGHRVASEKVGCIEIGNNVFVGSNTTILYNVRIGNNVVIGAGSLINKDVPDNVIIGGVPAKIIGDFDSFVNRRIQDSDKDDNSMKPKGEIIHVDYEGFCWDKFYEDRLKR